MKKKCNICKKEFNVRPSTYDRRKTCSKDCLKKYQSYKIKCHCYTCNKEIYKTKSQINKSKSGFVFCSNECVGKYNSKENNQNILRRCVICDKEYKSIKARKSHITCSRKCQGLWQSKYRVGENSSNYRGGGKEIICKYCDKKFITETPSQMKKFCSKNCKNKYWVKHTLHNEEFKKSHYEGNMRFRENHGETKPEKMVREFLESKGLVKDKDFFQEKGFFRRYFADFYIPKTKSIIEVNGDFWHGNPKIYGDANGLKPLYESQKNIIRKDKIKKNDFLKYGFNFYVLWESDIYDDIDKVMKDVKIQ